MAEYINLFDVFPTDFYIYDFIYANHQVIHRALIKVDEEGTTAAAATGVMIVPYSVPEPPIPFHADRPFIFVIRDKTAGVNLFMGRYSNPSGENVV